jgi:hypothetical protein
VDGPTDEPRHVAENDLVRALAATGVFETASVRGLFRDLLKHRLVGGADFRQHDVPRLDCAEVVHRCLGVPSGLTTLAGVLETMGERDAALAAVECADEIAALEALDGEVAPRDWAMLRGAMRGRPLPDAPAVARAASRNRVPWLPTYCRSIWHTFLLLAHANADGDGVAPWLTFLGLVTDRLDRESAAGVRAWSAGVVGVLGLTDALAGATTRAKGDVQRSRSLPSSGYLIIQLEPVIATADRVLVSSWRQWDVGAWCPVRSDDGEISMADVPRTVERIVARMEAEWSDPRADPRTRAGELILEFVLPDELLNLPVESWCWGSDSADPDELGLRYPVVIRSLRRLRTPQWHRAWFRRWDHLVDGSSAGSSPTAHLSGNRHGDDFVALRAALWPENVVCLVLSAPPDGAGGTGRREAELALREGFPVVLWHRDDCTSPAFLKAVETLLADGDFPSMPARVLELRRTAHTAGRTCDDEPSGSRLVLLWDDPWRRPDAPAA